jgi:hypothetical protein
MRVEVLGGLERRRRCSQDDKARIVEETLAPGAKVTEVARRNGVAASVVFTWRAHFADREQRFHAMVSSRFDRHGDWFRGLSWRQEFDCGRSAFACFLRRVEGGERCE